MPKTEAFPVPAQEIAAGVRLWLFAIDTACPVARDVAAAVLSDAERARAARFHRARDRERYIRARGALRQILAGCLATDPALVALTEAGAGKPVLAGGAGPHFSLSHCGDLAGVAVSERGPVGLDIEAAGQGIDPAALAPACLTADEAAAVARAPTAALRELRFLEFWTAKEAAVKCLGTGFRLDPRAVELALDGDRAVGIRAAGSTLVLAPLAPGPGIVGHLVQASPH